MPIVKPEKLGPEYNPWFWNPNRGSFKSAPLSFQERLSQIDTNLAVVWNPIMERWQVWDRCPRIEHPLCQGWRLLFIHKDVDGSYLPLDERVFARLWACSADMNGSGLQYFDRVASEMARDKEKAEAKSKQDSVDHAMESFDHSQIKVHMFGPSNGSKFSTYHQ
jgi:hypothetical protein